MAIEQELIDAYRAYLREDGRCSKKTIEGYTRTVRAIDNDLPCDADIATENELRTWLWRDGLAPASRAVYHAAIRSWYRWLAEVAQAITFDPSANIRRPKVPDGLPRVARDEHTEHILRHARMPYRLWAQLAAYAGLRCIEIYRLDRESITQEMIQIHRGKGDKPRQIPTHPIIWASVRDLPPGPITDITSERVLSSSFINYCRHSLGLRGVSMHRLRGRFATNGYRATKDILGLQRALGHASPKHTARYIEVTTTQVAGIISALPIYGAEDADTAPETP